MTLTYKIYDKKEKALKFGFGNWI